jgi:hypothetical protein
MYGIMQGDEEVEMLERGTGCRLVHENWWFRDGQRCKDGLKMDEYLHRSDGNVGYIRLDHQIL